MLTTHAFFHGRYKDNNSWRGVISCGINCALPNYGGALNNQIPSESMVIRSKTDICDKSIKMSQK